MNVIRTKAVELTAIPAIAYKQKLAAGGAGIKLLRMDQDASAVGTIDKRTGESKPCGTVDESLFPMEAFEEAMELTQGMPYSSRGKIVLTLQESQPEMEQEKEMDTLSSEAVKMIDSEEYKAIVERYSDEKGKMNYLLMNKDFIRFAAKSKTVSDMVGNKALTDDILTFVIKSRAAFIAGKKESLDDAQTAALIEDLDEIDPRSAFKELKLYINRLLASVRK